MKRNEFIIGITAFIAGASLCLMAMKGPCTEAVKEVESKWANIALKLVRSNVEDNFITWEILDNIPEDVFDEYMGEGAYVQYGTYLDESTMDADTVVSAIEQKILELQVND